MNYEEKINELETRIAKLEAIEHRRKIKNIIVYSLYGAVVLLLVIFLSILYSKLKPYKEQLDNLKEFGNNLKTDNIIDGYDSENYGDIFDYFFNY